MNSWCTVSLYSHFFLSSIWRMQKIWSVVDLLCLNLHWWSPIVSSMYGLTLREGHSVKFCMKLIAVISNDSYSSNNLPMIRQFFLIPNRMNKYMARDILSRLLLESVLLEFDHYLAIYTCSLILSFRYSIFLFLNCLLALYLTSFRLSPFLLLVSFDNFEHPSSNHALCYFSSK
jgi:hypothetical protein